MPFSVSTITLALLSLLVRLRSKVAYTIVLF